MVRGGPLSTRRGSARSSKPNRHHVTNARARLSSRELDEALQSPTMLDDPYPTYRVLRESAPLFWSVETERWFVSSLSDARTILRDAKGYSLDFGSTLLERYESPVREQIGDLVEHFKAPGFSADRPLHTTIRRRLASTFSKPEVELLRPRIAQRIGELLDEVAAPGRFDVIDALAFPLPAITIAELFGAPREDFPLFKRWSVDILNFGMTRLPPEEAARPANEAIVAMRSYIKDILETRREPGVAVSALVDQSSGLDALREDDLLAVCVTLLIAGHETTTSLIGNALYALLSDPREHELVAGGRVPLEAAVEEALRWEAPIQRVNRVVRSPEAPIRGTQLANGEVVEILIGSANRDEAVFVEPDRYSSERPKVANLAFGGGIHACIGAPLARIEAPLALEALFDRFPKMELVEDWSAEWGALRGLTSLIVTGSC
jgi:cytochrome P450